MRPAVWCFFTVSVLAGSMARHLALHQYAHFAIDAALVFANAYFTVANADLAAIAKYRAVMALTKKGE